MKITDVKVFRMSSVPKDDDWKEGWNWLFVKIYTDTGIHGVGEGSLQFKDHALTAEIEEFTIYDLETGEDVRIQYDFLAEELMFISSTGI